MFFSYLGWKVPWRLFATTSGKLAKFSSIGSYGKHTSFLCFKPTLYLVLPKYYVFTLIPSNLAEIAIITILTNQIQPYLNRRNSSLHNNYNYTVTEKLLIPQREEFYSEVLEPVTVSTKWLSQKYMF